MISIDELVRAARLAPTVGPFTLRRLFLRARVFASGTYTADDVRAALSFINTELSEILSAEEYALATSGIQALLVREDSAITVRQPTK